MSIDLRNETLLTLHQAAAKLPPSRRGRPVHISCLIRWAKDGVRTRAGEKVYLETLQMGGRLLTSVEALQRFADRQSFGGDNQSPAPADRPQPPRTPAARQRASEKAAAQLERLGI